MTQNKMSTELIDESEPASFYKITVPELIHYCHKTREYVMHDDCSGLMAANKDGV